MEILKLFKIQEIQNNSLNIDQSLDNYKLFARKHLEIQIKIGEIAKATNCYKYQLENNTVSTSTDSLLSMYISCLKKIVTIGLDKSYTDIENIVMQPSEFCLTDQFLNLYIDINDLIVSSSKDHFITLVEDYLSLGVSLGYCEHVIINNFADPEDVPNLVCNK